MAFSCVPTQVPPRLLANTKYSALRTWRADGGKEVGSEQEVSAGTSVPEVPPLVLDAHPWLRFAGAT